MGSAQIKFEQRFFRSLNSVVEPAVRRGLFSSRLLPTTLIILESEGYLSGQPRSTPLFCNRVGPYLLLSTARGKRSFWVRNLQKTPAVSYVLGGRSYSAQAQVISQDTDPDELACPALFRPLLLPLMALASRGWAFALLKRT